MPKLKVKIYRSSHLKYVAMRRRGDRTDMEQPPILAFFASPASPIDYDWERRIAHRRLLDADGRCGDWCEAIGLVIEG